MTACIHSSASKPHACKYVYNRQLNMLVPMVQAALDYASSVRVPMLEAERDEALAAAAEAQVHHADVPA